MKFIVKALSTLVLLFSAWGCVADSVFKVPASVPALKSFSVLILDEQGNVVYGKNASTVKPIASITKLMTAMVVLDADVDLDKKITITKDDRDMMRLTGSRLEYGAQLTRREALFLALMSSENRAASALGRTTFDSKDKFIKAMNKKAADLGLKSSRFADSVGLSAGNVSTASDLAKLLEAASTYPLIRQATTRLSMQVSPYAKRGPLNYVNTNRLLKNANWDIALSKTGYIHEAGRCLVMQAKIAGKPVTIVLLDSFGKLTPFGDSNRLRQWLLSSS